MRVPRTPSDVFSILAVEHLVYEERKDDIAIESSHSEGQVNNSLLLDIAERSTAHSRDKDGYLWRVFPARL